MTFIAMKSEAELAFICPCANTVTGMSYADLGRNYEKKAVPKWFLRKYGSLFRSMVSIANFRRRSLLSTFAWDSEDSLPLPVLLPRPIMSASEKPIFLRWDCRGTGPGTSALSARGPTPALAQQRHYFGDTVESASQVPGLRFR
jgi:hypothetical protein